ncbi:MAG: hypothetical protein JST54_23850 [Deltaproteobacteria bacterium]|nr:hypothetical protein [Deltaproteobacteria bacterium]
MISVLLAVALTSAPGTFPVPGEKGQVLDMKALRFHVPHGLALVERFYRQSFKGDAGISFTRGHDEKGETVTLRSKRDGESWSKAVLHDEGVATSIEVTPVIRMGSVDVNGKPPPVASLVIVRSSHVDEQLEQIGEDHAPKHE